MTNTRPPWRPLSVGVAAAAIVALFCPLPSAAAPAPCGQPQRYAAEAGAELLRLHRLDLGPTGRTGVTGRGVDIGEARSAMVAQSADTSVAAARTLAARPTDPSTPAELTRVVQQQAPPTNPAATHTNTRARRVGPLDLGNGSLTARAVWDPAMGCGRSTGEITRARSVLSYAGLLPDRTGRALVHMPRRLESRSTTALQRRGADVHTVARAGVTTGTVQVLGGAVQVKVLRPPTLATSISAAGSADVRYVPPMLEVSGVGVRTTLLTTPGDEIEINLDDPTPEEPAADEPPAGEPSVDSSPTANDPVDGETGAGETGAGEAGAGEAGAGETGAGAATAAAEHESAAVETPTVPGNPLRRLLAALPAGPLPGVAPGESLGLPRIPGAPELPRRGTPDGEPSREESAGGPTRSTLRISIGEVRQAVLGNAVAARVAALSLQITAGAATDRTTGGAGGQILDLDIGVLEAAAVAPEPAGDAIGGEDSDGGAATRSGSGGGLPVTGSRIDLTVVAGGLLLAAGLPCLVLGLRRRSFSA